MSHVFHRQPRRSYPVAVAGEGITIVDRTGRRYLDASGGAALSCLGHSHPRVIEAIGAQLELLAPPFFVTDDELEAIVVRLGQAIGAALARAGRAAA